jgi:hypothetical protein
MVNIDEDDGVFQAAFAGKPAPTGICGETQFCERR